jgi:8-oxo-dGTP pyrophosphatase MutT (NUDIX family)
VEQRQILSPGRYDVSHLTADFITRRLTRRGPIEAIADPPAPRGDHDLNPLMLRDETRPLTRASVLVPLIERPEGLAVLLTERSQHLTDHPGQISFPGGRQEPDDVDPIATALRETEEEIGLPRALVQVIGRLDTYVTGTGYSVTPIVGLIRPPFPIEANPVEVADVFEVPLGFIVDPDNHQCHSREFQGATRHYYVIPYQQRNIWGATAGMLVNLARLLAPDPA